MLHFSALNKGYRQKEQLLELYVVKFFVNWSISLGFKYTALTLHSSVKTHMQRGEKQQSNHKPEIGLILLKPNAQATHLQRSNLAPPKGFGPLTDWLTASRSTGLSHGGKASRLCHFGEPQKYLRLIFSKTRYSIRLALYFAYAAKPL